MNIAMAWIRIFSKKLKISFDIMIFKPANMLLCNYDQELRQNSRAGTLEGVPALLLPVGSSAKIIRRLLIKERAKAIRTKAVPATEVAINNYY